MAFAHRQPGSMGDFGARVAPVGTAQLAGRGSSFWSYRPFMLRLSGLRLSFADPSGLHDLVVFGTLLACAAASGRVAAQKEPMTVRG